MTIEPYNYNDVPSGRTDTLTQALDRCERLEKQLKIAVEALDSLRGICYPQVAEKALKQIKELEK
jgi:hypothetical protein